MESTITQSSTDRIEKEIILGAPQSRVWRALTDYTLFNSWFGVTLSSPFVVGKKTSGQITAKNYDHITLHLDVEAIEPETFFSFRWHPHAIEKGVDYSAEPTTLVAFTLEAADGGTRLSIVESGFDAIPAARRAAAFAGNANGWTGQMRNIQKFVEAPAAEA